MAIWRLTGIIISIVVYTSEGSGNRTQSMGPRLHGRHRQAILILMVSNGELYWNGMPLSQEFTAVVEAAAILSKPIQLQVGTYNPLFDTENDDIPLHNIHN